MFTLMTVPSSAPNALMTSAKRGGILNLKSYITSLSSNKTPWKSRRADGFDVANTL